MCGGGLGRTVCEFIALAWVIARRTQRVGGPTALGGKDRCSEGVAWTDENFDLRRRRSGISSIRNGLERLVEAKELTSNETPIGSGSTSQEFSSYEIQSGAHEYARWDSTIIPEA